MKDIVSIIVPVYKVEDYLPRCIDSILKQSYKYLELILVDDGSPDRCGEICDEYAKIDKRIKVIHKQNGGLSDARNVGIEASTGRYITFLDSDDWIHDGYIETLYKLLKMKNADISVCNFIRTSTETITENTPEIIIFEYSSLEALRQLTDKYSVQLSVAWGKLYKAELFKEVRFPIGKIHEDEFTTYKLLYKANKIVFTTEPLLYYWQRPDSIMGNGFKIKNRLHVIEAFEERADFFNGIDQAELRDKTYKSLFGIYKSVNENIHMFEDEDSLKRYKLDYNDFKTKLRKSRQHVKFKLYYEAYFISPRLSNIIEIINKKVSG